MRTYTQCTTILCIFEVIPRPVRLSVPIERVRRTVSHGSSTNCLIETKKFSRFRECFYRDNFFLQLKGSSSRDSKDIGRKQ